MKLYWPVAYTLDGECLFTYDSVRSESDARKVFDTWKNSYNKDLKHMHIDVVDTLSSDYKDRIIVKQGIFLDKIYINIDNVISDFDKGLRDFFGMNYKYSWIRDGDRETAQKLWKKIRESGHFYSTLQPVKQSIQMVKYLQDKKESGFGHKYIRLLLYIPYECENVVTLENDVRFWCKTWLNIPEDSEEIVVIYEDISDSERVRDISVLVENEGSILIDSHETNINRWENANGTGIHFKNVEYTLKELKTYEFIKNYSAGV